MANVWQAQQAPHRNAGSMASIPFCLMADAGAGLRRSILGRNIFHGLLCWMWATRFSKVATPHVNWNLAPDHRSIFSHCIVSLLAELWWPRPRESNPGSWDLPLSSGGGRAPWRHLICSAFKTLSKSEGVWYVQPTQFAVTPLTAFLPESLSSLDTRLFFLLIILN